MPPLAAHFGPTPSRLPTVPLRCPCPSQTRQQAPADPTGTGVMLTACDGQETFLAQVSRTIFLLEPSSIIPWVGGAKLSS